MVKKLPKSSTARVGCTNVTDNRQTDRQTDGRPIAYSERNVVRSLKTKVNLDNPVFTKRQRITLRLLYAISRPSVVCLLSVCMSVTLVHPTQAVELFGNFFNHTIAQGLYFSGAKNRWWGTPLSP